ncbi:MAG: hypothetical protein ACPGOY_00200 [Rhodospirillaceae bacterium]
MSQESRTTESGLVLNLSPAIGLAPGDDAVADYKRLLKSFLDRCPSGTRQKLASAIGTHKSFISQITNPSYRVPLPAQHIPELFRICRLSASEQSQFLALYRRAHPGAATVRTNGTTPNGASSALNQISESHGSGSGLPTLVSEESLIGQGQSISIPLPPDLNGDRRAEVETLIKDMATRIIHLARAKDL